jgi:hypothetical protein
MSRKVKPAQTNDQVRQPGSAIGNAEPPGVPELLASVRRFLGAGQPGTALQALTRTELQSAWVTNARGICHLRLGNARAALDAFRTLVLPPVGLHLRRDVPPVFKINYAAALLASGNVAGCQSALVELGGNPHPTLERIREAVARWKQGLSLWQRVSWWMGGEPERKVPLDFPLGDLE